MSIDKAVKKLRSAQKYLDEKAYNYDRAEEFGLSFDRWDDDLDEGVRILEEAEHAVTHIMEPAEPAESPDLPDLEEFDPFHEDNSPEDTVEAMASELHVIVVAMDELEKRVLRDRLTDADVAPTLPFNTSIQSGSHFLHIVNESAYPIETGTHIIRTGDTLCGRDNSEEPLFGRMWSSGQRAVTPTCPGCIAKGKNLSAKSVWHYLHRRD